MSRVLFRQPALFAHLGGQNGGFDCCPPARRNNSRADKWLPNGSTRGPVHGRPNTTHISLSWFRLLLCVGGTCAHTRTQNQHPHMCTSQLIWFPNQSCLLSHPPPRGPLRKLQHHCNHPSFLGSGADASHQYPAGGCAFMKERAAAVRGVMTQRPDSSSGADDFIRLMSSNI